MKSRGGSPAAVTDALLRRPLYQFSVPLLPKPLHRYQSPGWAAHALNLNEKLTFWELPQAYKLAYTLAFLSSYRLHSNRVVNSLANQTHQLTEILKDFERELGCLRFALGDGGGCPQHHQWECPF